MFSIIYSISLFLVIKWSGHMMEPVNKVPAAFFIANFGFILFILVDILFAFMWSVNSKGPYIWILDHFHIIRREQ